VYEIHFYVEESYNQNGNIQTRVVHRTVRTHIQ
jgi:hypothetical protein